MRDSLSISKCTYQSHLTKGQPVEAACAPSARVNLGQVVARQLRTPPLLTNAPHHEHSTRVKMTPLIVKLLLGLLSAAVAPCCGAGTTLHMRATGSVPLQRQSETFRVSAERYVRHRSDVDVRPAVMDGLPGGMAAGCQRALVGRLV